jgi:DNA-directed RNA polymerase subunit N (RpoN/RPB10)
LTAVRDVPTVSVEFAASVSEEPIRCAECGRPWLERDERWQAPLAVGDEEAEDALEAIVMRRSTAGRWSACPVGTDRQPAR